MRVLGFSDPLVPLVLSGAKTVTRRGLTARRRFAPGQIVAVGEALVPGPCGTVRYRADQTVVTDWRPTAVLPHMLAEWTWKTRTLAGTYMPAWAARGFLVITSATEDEAAAISDEEAIREGARNVGFWRWALADGRSELRADSPREAFFAYWAHLHGEPPTPGVLGTRIEFRLATLAEGRAALTEGKS